MRALRSRNYISSPASRCFAGLLSILMVVTPVAGQSADEQTSPSTSSTATKTHRKKPSAKSHKQASRKVTASQAARAARTARIHQAFVASTELRTMAQELGNLRTPEAYAGVTAYARKHSGDAAATAYLALGHAYLADKRYGEAEQSLRQARQAGRRDCFGVNAAHFRLLGRLPLRLGRGRLGQHGAPEIQALMVFTRGSLRLHPMRRFPEFQRFLVSGIPRRGPYREGHLALIEQWHRDGRLAIAGALGNPPNRGLLAFTVADEAQVAECVAADPYSAAGLVASWHVEPWAVVT